MRRFFAGLLLASVVGCQQPKPAEAPLLAPPPPDPWARVDAYALAAPVALSSDADGLAAYLSKAGGPYEVARAIYRWIAANISYDVTGLSSGEYGDLTPSAVLARKKAVCGGFGNLFEELAHRAGLEAVTVFGHAKGTGYRVGEPLRGVSNHAWNAFKTGETWHLVDCTWGAGALEDSGLYEAHFEPFYFDTPPGLFAYTHLPGDPQWQLLEAPIAREDFLASPWLKPAFFHAGLRPDSVYTEKGPSTIQLVVKTKVSGELRAYLVSGGEKVFATPLLAVISENEVRFQASPPGPGSYAIRLFAQHERSPEALEWAGDFPVTIE